MAELLNRLVASSSIDESKPLGTRIGNGCALIRNGVFIANLLAAD
jgi:hypothetical protein